MVNHPNRKRTKLGDVRYVVSWIDRAEMRKSASSEDDLVERLHAAERRKAFSIAADAKGWAVANSIRDEYGNPRFEKQTFWREDEDLPPEWQQSEYQEWMDGSWQPLVF